MLLDNKERGVPATGVKQNPDNINEGKEKVKIHKKQIDKTTL